MFLKINTAGTNPLWDRGTHILSGATSALGVIADTARHSSQTGRQFRALQRRLKYFMSGADVDLRNNVFAYGEAHFWGHEAYVDLDPGIARITDWHVAQAKKVA